MTIHEVPLRSLDEGRRFRYYSESGRPVCEGTLLRLTSCSATVLLDGVKKERTFATVAGQQVTVRERLDPVHWAPSTPVERLEGKVDVAKTWQEKQIQQMKEKSTMVALPGAAGSKNGRGKVKYVAKANAKPENDCMCGCGAKVKGRFKMGHDSRFFSLLGKVVKGEMKFGELNATMRGIAKNAAGAARLHKSHSTA